MSLHEKETQLFFLPIEHVQLERSLLSHTLGARKVGSFPSDKKKSFLHPSQRECEMTSGVVSTFNFIKSSCSRHRNNVEFSLKLARSRATIHRQHRERFDLHMASFYANSLHDGITKIIYIYIQSESDQYCMNERDLFFLPLLCLFFTFNISVFFRAFLRRAQEVHRRGPFLRLQSPMTHQRMISPLSVHFIAKLISITQHCTRLITSHHRLGII